MNRRKTSENHQLSISMIKMVMSGFVVLVLLLFSGCRSVQLKSGAVGTDTIELVSPSSMNKDALRVVARVEQVNGLVDGQSSYSLVIEKVVKYGATFSSVEPKVGDLIIMSAPQDVSIRKGAVILVDILTPRIDQGERPLKVRMG